MKNFPLFLLLIFGASCSGGNDAVQRKPSALPYLSVYPDSTDASGKPVPRVIDDYTLIDQNGKSFSAQQLRGKIYVAEFFFTSCRTICPQMNKELMQVQDKFRGNKKIALLSHTIDPDRDSAAALAAFAPSLKAEKDQWIFLTGDARKIYRTAREVYKLPEPMPADSIDDFFHSSQVALVDAEGLVRGYYDATNSEEVAKLIGDIETLLKESSP